MLLVEFLLFVGTTCAWSGISVAKERPEILQTFKARQRDSEFRDDKDVVQQDSARNDEPLRLLVAVEPSPFTYVCGYSNRFQELFRCLDQKSEVEIVTVEVVAEKESLPHEQFGFPIYYTRGFCCWFYKRMSLSFDWTLQLLRRIWKFKPNLLHVTSL